MIGEKIKIKGTEEIVQMQKVDDLEKSVKETALQEKVDALEKFVARLEERLEMFEQRYVKDAKLVDYSSFDKLHSLVRSKSLEVKCDRCKYAARNKARV